ncbi:hypothetical protein NOK12_06330 [Nocardioides sp. OK12]|uniref:N-acetyltransferase domain-containing protein n=1 Tax=Nocardioides marinisabuli TaxID=419476 RepID=A0A7Y9F4D0_9ACTN|nr:MULTISPECIES: hypothetical protein [Nocardioides]NYD58445.1 hypothetical protein [Nocardioides marinisabuli]GHJ58114.1 hypothetical protein NOK12_06330 [Nocardioides sp. OK12]
MDLLAEHWLDVLGWGGSALLVFSLMQQRVLRFRVLNLAAGLALLLFNALIEVWPMVGLNAVTSAINVWFLLKLVGQRHDDHVFEVLEVGADDVYLHHVLRTHRADIARFQPDFDGRPDPVDDHAFLVQRGDETVGVVVVRREGDVAHVRLDYVTPRFRDFTPGEFVWRRSDALRELGFTRVVTAPRMVGAYYDHLGFRRDGEAYVLDLAPS